MLKSSFFIRVYLQLHRKCLMVLRPGIIFIALIALKRHGAPYSKQWELNNISSKLSWFYSGHTAEHVETLYFVSLLYCIYVVDTWMFQQFFHYNCKILSLLTLLDDCSI